MQPNTDATRVRDGSVTECFDEVNAFNTDWPKIFRCARFPCLFGTHICAVTSMYGQQLHRHAATPAQTRTD